MGTVVRGAIQYIEPAYRRLLAHEAVAPHLMGGLAGAMWIDHLVGVATRALETKPDDQDLAAGIDYLKQRIPAYFPQEGSRSPFPHGVDPFPAKPEAYKARNGF